MKKLGRISRAALMAAMVMALMASAGAAMAASRLPADGGGGGRSVGYGRWVFYGRMMMSRLQLLSARAWSTFGARSRLPADDGGGGRAYGPVVLPNPVGTVILDD